METASHTWVITKSQPHADSVVIQLRRLGLTALALPCIEHQWQDWPELRQLGASQSALLFVTSRAAAARLEIPQGAYGGITVAAISPTTSATLEARGIRVSLSARGGVRELARVVHDSSVPDGTEVFYPTSDAALRQPEHLAAVATLSRRLRVHTKAVYSTVPPTNLRQELAALAGTAETLHGFCFWSPSAVENFAAAGGFGLPPAAVVLTGGSTERCWRDSAPPAWRRAFRHDAETPLEWSLRFLERGANAANS